ncbi:hypothetical protein PV04_07619 [Phialophora macrospora]|uniref:N-acetyltransferase domain-containing protein n=1 Tax=Phialophora macrospora TaxID=1851006 RepID=A0A0D2FBF7_9EURO|nr:hypothetical protein PV04_07619 [Phialophora macrospora]
MQPDPETQDQQHQHQHHQQPPAFPTLQTERLVLRLFDPSRPSDYAAVLSMYDSPYARRTFDPRPAATDAKKKKKKVPFPTHPWHLVSLRDDDDDDDDGAKVIGLTSLFLRHPLPSPDLGYFVKEEYTGKGYATEAGKAALKWWTEDMGVQDIWAGTMDTNYASQRVAGKIGFVDGGVLRVVVADGVVKEGRAFVQPGKRRWLDGVVVDVRQREGVNMEVEVRKHSE